MNQVGKTGTVIESHYGFIVQTLISYASDNTERDRFDECFDNWIKQDYWIKIIHNIEVDLINLSKEEQEFLNTFIAWIKEALQYTSVIVVEGNL